MLSKSVVLLVLAGLLLIANPVSAEWQCDPSLSCSGSSAELGVQVWAPNPQIAPATRPLYETIGDCYNTCIANASFTPVECSNLYWTNGRQSNRDVRVSFCTICTEGLGTNPNPSSTNTPGHEFQGCTNPSLSTTTALSPVVPSVGAGEDPHFKTWAGTFYDYMGECDLTLIQAPFFDDNKNQTLDIAIRTKIRYQYSYIEAAAVKIGDEVMEVSSFGEYALNGITKAELPNTISGYTITYAQLNDKVHSFTIDLGNGEDITLRTFKDWVSVKLSNPSKGRYHKSVGMMGEFGTGKLYGRDGVTVIDSDPNALAAEWQVRDNEPMIFQTARAPQYPAACKLPDPPKKTGRRLGEKSVSEEAAKKACMTAGAENLEGCIHDVMATGDLELAAAGVF